MPMLARKKGGICHMACAFQALSNQQDFLPPVIMASCALIHVCDDRVPLGPLL
jgi:hypothetical protein